MQFQIGLYSVEIKEHGYVQVDDTVCTKDLTVPAHLQRYRVVQSGWENEPDAKTIGYAVSRYDLPDYTERLYPFHAYTRLAERLGLPVDEQRLEQQWIRRFRRIYGLRQRNNVDVTDNPYFRYYRDLILWCRKRPMPPAFSQVLKKMIKHYGGKNEEDIPCSYSGCCNIKEKRKELLTKWDAFVTQFAKYKEKHEKWLASKPTRNGFVTELSEEPLYILDKDISVTKEQIDVIERSGVGKSTIVMRHPITEEMVTILEM